jgi:predicted flap endonuclease-1-like 5' DNA nuclease
LTQADLLKQGATPHGRKEIARRSGIDSALILRWINHVDLTRVKGVNEQYAELLEAAGVDTVPELAQRVPENLYQKLLTTNEEKHLSPQTPSATEVNGWVAQARQLPRVINY